MTSPPKTEIYHVCIQSLLADVELEAREGKRPRRVVDDVHLAGVEAGGQRRRGQVELEHRRLSIGSGQLGGLDRRRLERAHAAAEKRDARHDLDAAARRAAG